MNMNTTKTTKDIKYKYFYPKSNITNIVIAIHGFAGDKDSSVINAIANALNQNTLVVTFDLPCHGQDNRKDNKLRLNECIEYLKTVVSYIASVYPLIPISIFATSFGAYLFLLYLSNANYKFEHIILRSPAIFMDKVLVNSILRDHNITFETLLKQDVNLGYNKTIMVDKQFLKSLQNNSLIHSKFSQHIEIIQGNQDDVVDINENEKYYNSNFLDYTLHYIKGANHRFKNPGELEQIVNITKSIIH